MDIAIEHPTAEFFLWIATSDRNGHKTFDPRPQSAFALLCLRRDGSQLGLQTSNGSSAADDYNAKALLIGATTALQYLPEGAALHIISDQNWFIGILNEDRILRVKREYDRPNRSSKYSYEREWRDFDAACNEKNIGITSARPQSKRGKTILTEIKESASLCARNIGIPHSDWDL